MQKWLGAAVAATIAAAGVGCASVAPVDVPTQALGQWGGTGVNLELTDSSAYFGFRCSAFIATHAPAPGSDGYFSIAGTYHYGGGQYSATVVGHFAPDEIVFTVTPGWFNHGSADVYSARYHAASNPNEGIACAA